MYENGNPLTENENRESELKDNIPETENVVNNESENESAATVTEQKIVLSPDVVNADVVRKKKEPDKKQYFIFAIVACLICAVIGGLTGGIVSSVVIVISHQLLAAL